MSLLSKFTRAPTPEPIRASDNERVSSRASKPPTSGRTKSQQVPVVTPQTNSYNSYNPFGISSYTTRMSSKSASKFGLPSLSTSQSGRYTRAPPSRTQVIPPVNNASYFQPFSRETSGQGSARLSESPAPASTGLRSIFTRSSQQSNRSQPVAPPSARAVAPEATQTKQRKRREREEEKSERAGVGGGPVLPPPSTKAAPGRPAADSVVPPHAVHPTLVQLPTSGDESQVSSCHLLISYPY